MYKEPPGEAGQLRLLLSKIEERRDIMNQKRKDISDTLLELESAEDACLARMAELGVTKDG